MAFDLPFTRDTAGWWRYLFGMSPTNWTWRVKQGVTRWQGQNHCVGLLGITRFSDLSIITYDYGLQDINTVIIDCAFGYWQERRLTIDYPTYPGDDYEWSTAEFKEWRANRDLCFLVDLLVLEPLDHCLLADILRGYALEFEVRVESILKDLKKYLIEAIKDRDCYKELLYATVEDHNEMGRAYKVKLATLKAKLEQRSSAPLATEVECIQLRSRVISLESELANLTQRFTVLG